MTASSRVGSDAAPEMCFTLREDTRTGRSDADQIKALPLEACNEEQAAYQTWRVRSSADRDSPQACPGTPFASDGPNIEWRIV